MSLTLLENSVLTYSQQVYKHPPEWEVSGSTPFVSGNLLLDHFLNHMSVDNGVRIILKKGPIFHQIDQVEIVDEAKATWFMLKYSV